MLNQSEASNKKLKSLLLKSLESDGFFYIINHTIPLERYKSLIQLQHSFFNLPEKRELQKKEGKKGFLRGYIPMGLESGNKDLYEQKEGFSYGFENQIKKQHLLESENIWPTNPVFKQELSYLFNEFSNISLQITKLLSEILSIDITSQCLQGHEISLMRLFHYLKSTKPVENCDLTIGSSPHTDWGFLTLILQSHAEIQQQGGLQVFHIQTWKDIPSIENAIIVNGGDYLTLLSNGRFKSPLHRVINGKQDRFSYVYFFYPDKDAPLPNTHSEQNLSLLKNQIDESMQNESFLKQTTFGDIIAKKWTEVSKY